MSRPDTITCPPTCSSAEERPSHGHHTAGELPLSAINCPSKCDWRPTTPAPQHNPRFDFAHAACWARFPTGSPPDASSLGGDSPNGEGPAGPEFRSRPVPANANARTAPMSRSTIHDLLDPTPPLSGHAAQSVDVSTTLRSLLGAFSQHCPVDRPFLVTTDTHAVLQNLLAAWTPPQAPSLPPPTAVAGRLTTRRGTKLSVLYRYQPGVPVEYPESGLGAPVGHLIPMTPGTRLPWVDFAYSRGAPDGGSAKEDVFFTDLLVDQNGVPVPCKKRHSTCQGLKASTRQDVQGRLAAVREARQRLSSPQRDIFLHTSAYISAVCQLGCRRPLQQDTGRTGQELQDYEREQQLAEHFRRGYSAPSRCAGRIVYHEYPDPTDKNGSRAYLSCEHYSRQTPDHWSDFSIQDGAYDVNYIAAHFSNDSEELARIKGAAAAEDIGPLASCRTLRNHTVQTLHCPIDHRVDGRLAQVELCHIDCDVKFRVWFSTNLQECPFVLVTLQGIHRHPIPLPEKTPQVLRSQILQLLHTVRHDLPDMTPRRFLRHPTLKSFLIQVFPSHPTATLTTLHPSLANRAHLAAYIAQVREEHFPHGTDWKGILHLKRVQDQQLPAHQHYIRVVLDLDNAALTPHDEDDEPAPPGEQRTRMVICMSPDCSARLKNAQYLQSDISFKRVIEYDEFEITGMDRDANTSKFPLPSSFPLFSALTAPNSVVFCRVYLTRHTAAAHQLIFHEINKIVYHNTGRALHWRHLHGRDPMIFLLGSFYTGARTNTGAKQKSESILGLGLHLVERAAELPADRMDMHEPERSLRSLGPYDHLRRVYRVCKVHNYRNIQQCAVPEHVRQLMRSLTCIRHADWQGAIDQILRDGGKAAKDWFNDKESCRFAFPGNLLGAQLYSSPPTSTAATQKLAQALADFDNLRRVLTAPHLQSSSAQAVLKQEITSATLHARKAANAYDRQRLDSQAGNSASTGPIMNFAPAHVLPTAPLREQPQRLADRTPVSPAYLSPPVPPHHPGIDVQTHSLEASSKFFVVNPGREEGIYTSAPKASATAATRLRPRTPKPRRSGPCHACVGTGMSAAASVFSASRARSPLGGERLRPDLRIQRHGVLTRRDEDLQDIRIRGSRDVAELVNWLEADDKN
ncbi:hypothetical protein B0H14DRAFT_3518892 [Mycena olivaceomarginata]|nr:hypothetical protein B0H14DRAFT_3518892 [Mycena olivaceomarginata]